MITEDNVDKALDHLRDNAYGDAQMRAERLYMEQWIKTVLAQEQSKSTATSIAASEVDARQSAAYIEALDVYKLAIHKDEEARFMRSAAETKIEAWRTQCSNRRAEGKAY